MKVFITGGSGWIGRNIIPKLIAKNHQVTSLARSDDSANRLTSMGAEVVRGELTDLDVLRDSAKGMDAVIHCGFVHDFDSPAHNMVNNMKVDEAAIKALAEGLGHGSGKIFINTSGCMGGATRQGSTFTEDFTAESPRRDYVADLRSQGLKAFAVRASPITHGEGDKGLLPMLTKSYKAAGEAGYVEGIVWPSCHVADTAEIYVKILEKADKVNHMFYHAVAETEIPFKSIVNAVAQKTGLKAVVVTPEQAKERYGFVGMFMGMNAPTSNTITKTDLDWEPKENTLIEDIKMYSTYA